jgi:Bacterial HORMA domain 2
MTTVTVNTYTHSVVYVADNILKSLKDIIREVGLDPSNLINGYETNMRALRAWLSSQDLRRVNLEIYDPVTDALITRWDLDIAYGWSADDGSFWTDTDQLKYAIRKAGVAPSTARYRLLLDSNPARPDVDGWSRVTSRSTAGMVRQSLGSTIEHSGLGASAAYWRKT